jgi:hypothetical protein
MRSSTTNTKDHNRTDATGFELDRLFSSKDYESSARLSVDDAIVYRNADFRPVHLDHHHHERVGKADSAPSPLHIIADANIYKP